MQENTASLYSLCKLIMNIQKSMNIKKEHKNYTNEVLKTGVCLGGKLSLFSDISQNSILEKQTLHKIQYEKNGLFIKFNMRNMDSSQNSAWEKRTLHKIQHEKNGFFTKFNMRKMDSSQNSISEKRTSQNLIAFMFTFFEGHRTYSPFF